MTSNSNLKKQARDYAAQHGVPYAQARREVLAAGPGNPGFTNVAMFTIQQAERADGVLPYPFHVDAHGFVDRQDFWRGDPFRLIGFTADPNRHQIDLRAQDWGSDPQAALGMHPVLADRDGHFATYAGPVATITPHTAQRPVPQTVTVQYRTRDGHAEIAAGVGHLLWLLNARDFDGPIEDGKITEQAQREMLNWLLLDDGGQDLDLDAFYGHLEELAEDTDPDDDDPAAKVLSATLNPGQVQAWLRARYGA